MKKSVSILILALISLILCGCSVSAPVLFETIDIYSKGESEDTQLILENDYLRLLFDCESTQFSIEDKAQGNIWYSNPPDAESDSVAIDSIKEKLLSQVVLTYGQISGTVTEINNYTLSIKNESYQWEAFDNSIKVSYTIGKVDVVYIVPPGMTETRFMTYYTQMNTEQQGMLGNYYRIIDINKLRSTDNRAELLEKYPELENERILELREDLPSHIMTRLETAFEDAGYTFEDYQTDTHADEESESETPVFNISVIYTLDGPDFIVTVPLDEIEYRHDYPILSLSVLPYFGAAGIDDDGFMLVPDASGAIIYNNNNKHNQAVYSINLYGFDNALKRTAVINENYSYMPVFGAAVADNAYLCIIEEGDSSSAIEADVSGRTHSYNAVNSKYTVINWDDADISKANVVAKVFDRSEKTGAFSQRYIFISEPDYVSMATAYRNYLMSRYPTLVPHNEENLPAVLGLVGAIDRIENTFGIPLQKSFALTTYSEAADIISDFTNKGIPGLRVNYVGWFNDGVLHDAPGDIKLISELGGKKEFENLLNSAAKNNAEMFFEADFTFIHNGSLFNGYGVNRDSAKYLSRDIAQLYPFCIACFGDRTGSYGERYSHYLANPEYTMKTIDSFNTELHKIGAKNITFGSIGRLLNSDFNRRKLYSRTDAMNLQTEKLAELMASNTKIMIHEGNIYAVPYADVVIDVAMDANNFNIIDENIPFYQIVMHGLVPYTGSPINLSPDYERNILRTVETGAGLYFMLMNAPGEELQETGYTRYYSADINRWGDEPIELYHKINNELSHTAAQFITQHQRLAPQVTLTGYEDGTLVIVNYSSETFSYDDVDVSGMDFAVIRK